MELEFRAAEERLVAEQAVFAPYGDADRGAWARVGGG